MKQRVLATIIDFDEATRNASTYDEMRCVLTAIADKIGKCNEQIKSLEAIYNAGEEKLKQLFEKNHPHLPFVVGEYSFTFHTSYYEAMKDDLRIKIFEDIKNDSGECKYTVMFYKGFGTPKWYITRNETDYRISKPAFISNPPCKFDTLKEASETAVRLLTKTER